MTGIISTDSMVVVGRTIGIDSRSGCGDDDEHTCCMIVAGGAEEWGCCSPVAGGLIIRMPPHPPPLLCLCPFDTLQSSFSNSRFSGFSGSEPATYKFPLSILVATYTKGVGVKSPSFRKSCLL